MSTSPIVITPSTSVVLVNTADYSGNPVVLLPNLAGPGALGRVITVRDNDGGSVNPAKSIYLSTTGGARFQSELSSITLSSFRITQPYGFITITPRLNDGLGNTNYGLMNVYAFPEASPAAYVNTFNTNFGYISTLSTINLAVNQNTLIAGNLTVGGSITYASPGATTLDIGRVNTNLLSAATVLNSNFYGVNVGASTINTSTFVVRDSGSVLLPNAGTWSNAAAFAGTADPNSLTLGNPAGSAGAQIGLSSNFFGLRSFSVDGGANKFSTTVVLRDGTVGVNVAGINDIGSIATSNFPFYVRGGVQLSNLGVNNNIGIFKTSAVDVSYVEVAQFGVGVGSASNYRIDTSSNIAEGFFGPAFTNQYNWLTVNKNGSIKFWTGSAGPTSERVTIDNAGRVGIGTTTPSYTVDISGSFSASTINYAKLYTSSVFIGDMNGNANTLRFSGTASDGRSDNTYDHTVIGERIWTGTENSELLLFKGNDPFISGNIDRIRHLAPYHQFDVMRGSGGTWTQTGNPPTPDTPNALIIQPIGTTAGNGAIGVNISPSYNLDVSGNARISGNVGIGITPAPAYTLDVSGQLRTSGSARLGSYTAPVNIGYDGSAYILLGRERTVPGASYIDFNIDGTATNGSRIIRNSGVDGTFDITNIGNGNLRFGTSNTNGRMVINSNGNVGIGRTPDTSYALDVSGNARIINSGSGSAKIDFSAGGGSCSVIRQTGTIGNVDFINNGTGVIAFTTDYGGYNGKFIMDASGRFGVNMGTQFPSYNLDVSGTARITDSIRIGETSQSGLWVAVGGGFGTSHTIATSTDGITWTGIGTSIFSTSGRNIAWSGSLWVAVGEGTNTIAYSYDGVNWTGIGTSIFSSYGSGVAWNGSLWVAVGTGTSHTIATSTDGINWTGRGKTVFSTGGFGVAWNGSLWVAVGLGTNTIAYSYDGVNWTGIGTSIFSIGGIGVAWNGSLWVAVGSGGSVIASSFDGINWARNTIPVFSNYGRGIAWNGSLWVAVGIGTNTIAYSYDGFKWTGLGTSIFSNYGLGVAWNGSLWVAVGSGGNNFATSPDGITWTGRGSAAFSIEGYGVAYSTRVNRQIKSDNLSIYTQNIPYYLDGSNNIFSYKDNITVNTNLRLNGDLYYKSYLSYSCRAWVNFSATGGSITLLGQGNVTSVTRNSTGDFTINFTNFMPDSNYAVVALGPSDDLTNGTACVSLAMDTPAINGVKLKTISQVRLLCSSTESPIMYDAPNMSVAIFR